MSLIEDSPEVDHDLDLTFSGEFDAALNMSLDAAPPHAPEPPVSRVGTFIGPRAVALAWLVAMVIVMAINPTPVDPIEPGFVLNTIGSLAVLAFYGTIVAGATRLRSTAAIGLGAGGFMLAGHFLCGFEGHLPMTGAIWPAQLMLIAGATAVSGLALVTRR